MLKWLINSKIGVTQCINQGAPSLISNNSTKISDSKVPPIKYKWLCWPLPVDSDAVGANHQFWKLVNKQFNSCSQITQLMGHFLQMKSTLIIWQLLIFQDSSTQPGFFFWRAILLEGKSVGVWESVQNF